MNKFILYTSSYIQKESNSVYPNRVFISNAESLKAAVRFDHVCAKYKDSRRSNANFITSNVIVMDCDNDHSDNPDEWISPEFFEDNLIEVSFAIALSRNHNKSKNNKSARPRFHVYFPIAEINDTNEYAKLKERIQKAFPFFDKNALDAARFIFGCETECIWHEGNKSIIEFLDNYEVLTVGQEKSTVEIIPEGERNSTLSRYAAKVIKRNGNTNKAHTLFLEKASLCIPPLEDRELNSIWKSAVKFGERVSQQNGYISPEEFEATNKTDGELVKYSFRPKDFSDVGQALVLSHISENKLRYNSSTDILAYNGSYWEESTSKAQRLVHELTESQLNECAKARKTLLIRGVDLGMDPSIFSLRSNTAIKLNEEQTTIFKAYKEMLEYSKFVLARRNSNNISATLKEVRPMLEIDIESLDKDPFLLNTPDGTYDLRTGLFKEHDYRDYITKQTSVIPSNKGMEIWLEALDTFFCGDNEMIEYVQRIMGLAAIGKVEDESLVISYGDGCNGKSSFFNAIAKVLGSYSGVLSADALTSNRVRNIKPEMAELKGKRLVIASETESGQRLSTSAVKQLCSTDRIYAEKKYKDPFSFMPSHTLVLYTNHLPEVDEVDEGTWRRLKIIPFEAKINPKSDIKNYSDYLYENAGGAILKWIIDGAKRIIEEDYHLNTPNKVQEHIDKYRDLNDWLGDFIYDCCELDNSFTEKSGELYSQYRNYCERRNTHTHSTTSFYQALEAKGFKRSVTSKGKFFSGIRLKGYY